MPNEQILVVDDDKAVVRLMRGYLEQAGFQVSVAYNGESAMHILRRDHPDLVLLDLMLPDLDGRAITRQVRSDPEIAHTPIIMLTARVADDDKILGLELGADDYVTKPYNPREVVARVRARLRAAGDLQRAAQNRVLRAGDLELDAGRHQARLAGSEVNLTATEFNLLRALMEEAGYVLTRSDLMRHALGSEFAGMERTIDSHMRNLRRKLESAAQDGQPPTITTIYGVGYRLESAGER
jgi:two-component system, OmpR family, alkaline phosphatase synthesis response regulator PhoP